jgi:hypothetical protein
MNCQQCQRRLMGAEKPGFPDLAVQAHLAQCLLCRDLQRQLLFVESNVPRIPLPASDAKARLLQQILQPSAEPAPSPSRAVRLQLAGHWREAGMGLAAAVVLVACGLWLGSALSRTKPAVTAPADEQAKNPEMAPMSKPRPDPFNSAKQPAPPSSKTLVAKVMECDLKLAQAQTPRERVEALAELANVLQRETALLSKSARPTELNKLASLYKQVIQDGVLPRARELPMEERKEVLPTVTAQLGHARREAEQLAKSTPRSAEAMQTIAFAARDGDLQLRGLLQEGLE